MKSNRNKGTILLSFVDSRLTTEMLLNCEDIPKSAKHFVVTT
ncbi:hypothetical protein [Neobacillus muris]|nr:hypothetical protein [Neobacillus muris]